MPAHYTVIQYVPNPATDERVNIGIAGYSEGSVLIRLLVDWQRVKAIGGKTSVNRDRIETLFRDINEPRLVEMIETWHNSIQFTTPGSSLWSLADTVDEAAQYYLVDPPIAANTVRSHSDVVAYAKDRLSASVTLLLGVRASKNLVRRKMDVTGRLGIARRFDLGICNGRPLHVLQALTFEGVRNQELRFQATAFLAEEVQGMLPLTVVVAPPSLRAAMIYEDAKKTLSALNARVVTEEEFEGVANEIAAEAATHLA